MLLLWWDDEYIGDGKRGGRKILGGRGNGGVDGDGVQGE